MSKKVSVGFGILALILTALLVVPRMVTLNSWKPEIEKKVSAALGRPVSIDGRVGFHILPFPGISLSDVRVANEKWGQHPEMMTANEVTVTVSLLPLFMRTIELSQIKITCPNFNCSSCFIRIRSFLYTPCRQNSWWKGFWQPYSTADRIG